MTADRAHPTSEPRGAEMLDATQQLIDLLEFGQRAWVILANVLDDDECQFDHQPDGVFRGWERGPCCLASASCHGVIDAHHDDYAKPLEVRWVCRGHHRQLDRERRAIHGAVRPVEAR